jgi:hypothetical protein
MQRGLYSDEIDRLMSKYVSKGFVKTIPYDILNKLDFQKKKPFVDRDLFVITPRAVVLNLDAHDKPGSHWVALYVTPKTVEYFDSFAEEPPAKVDVEIQKFVKRYSRDMLQYKINSVKQQRTNSDNCGYFAMKFLVNRMNGKTFKQATGWDIIEKSIKGEKDIKKFKEHVNDFGYV